MLLRELGRDAEADQLIATYMREKKAGPDYWQWGNHHGGTSALDPAIVVEFNKMAEGVAPTISVLEVLRYIAEHRSWRDGYLEVLENATMEEIRLALKAAPGIDLQDIVREMMRFIRTAGGHDFRSIGLKAAAAMREIAAENPLNAARARSFGVPPAEIDAANRLADPATPPAKKRRANSARKRRDGSFDGWLH